MTTIVGADGCKIGWFYFRREKDLISFDIASDLESLVNSLPSNSRIYIDIPIGLIDEGSDGRDCDRIARKALGHPRASSVFSAPAFTVLYAENFEDAKRRSMNAIGKMLSQQAFAITPKIHEVNMYLASNLNSEIVVREIHPEVCFWGLNGRRAMRIPKKKPAGFDERLEVLRRFVPSIDTLIDGPLTKYTRSVVARDDILDALVALVVGCTSDDKLQTMPPSPKLDVRGLPMEMVYTEEPNEYAL